MTADTMRQPVDTVAVDRGGMMTVVWRDGMRKSYHPMWLRDNCPCTHCRHPSGQKLISVSDWPPNVGITAAAARGDTVQVHFMPHHEAQFDAAWLRHFGADDAPRKQPWDADTLALATVTRDYTALAAGGGALGEWLGFILRHGFALLRGAPLAAAAVCEVAEWFGHVRHTNYGRLFDVKAVVKPNNLAYTGMALSVHTDNPYRDPPPALQLLHCLQNTLAGGHSMAVDGFMAAQILQQENPAHYDTLTRYAVPFRFHDPDGGADLRNRLPVLQVAADATAELRAVNFNNRALAAIDMAADAQPQYYAAYRHFDEILRRDQLALQFKMTPGDLFVVDNRRVLHGRSGFSGGGGRHLQGCYADADGLLSTWRILNAAPR